MDLLVEGEDALRRGEWREAKLAFERALEESESARAFEGLGNACRWLVETGPTCRAFTRAYRLYRQAGEQRAAARTAISLALTELYFRNEPAVCRGWLERADRLVAELGPTSEAAWAQLVRAHLLLQRERDPERALVVATAAEETARRAGDLDAEMTARAVAGVALVGLGRVDDGMRALDEATAAAVGGELDNLDAISSTCCALIDACKRVRDFDRAAQWCDQMTEFCERWSDKITFIACRAHYADILIWRGAWAEAETELLGNLGGLAAVHRERLADSLVRVAELRRRQGRLEQAAELLAQAESHPLAPVVAAALALDRGEASEALRWADRALRRVPPELLTERAGVLELVARAAVAAEELDVARAAADELREIAARLASDPVRASASLAAGLLAEANGLLEHAQRALEDAVDLFGASGGRYEAAKARQELARVLAARGHEQAAAREARAAAAELAALGAAARSAQSDGAGLSPRELEVLRLIARGRSNQEIARDLFLSVRTVERHVSNVYDKIGASGKAARAAAASYALVEGYA